VHGVDVGVRLTSSLLASRDVVGNTISELISTRCYTDSCLMPSWLSSENMQIMLGGRWSVMLPYCKLHLPV